jgi:outer membrane protein OmpA-like peptidoglycan-associated protein
MSLDAQRSSCWRPRTALAAVLWAMLMLHGCGTSPKPAEPPATSTTPPAPAAVPRASTLSAERLWLQSWFKGTPVRVAQQRDGAVSVDVPREFCFDGGQSKVLRPLAAVLDKVSQSLRRKPKARLELLAAPGDDAQDTALALQRAKQLRSHLQAQGVPAAQLGSPSVSATPAVQLRLALTAP